MTFHKIWYRAVITTFFCTQTFWLKRESKGYLAWRSIFISARNLLNIYRRYECFQQTFAERNEAFYVHLSFNMRSRALQIIKQKWFYAVTSIQPLKYFYNILRLTSFFVIPAVLAYQRWPKSVLTSSKATDNNKAHAPPLLWWVFRTLQYVGHRKVLLKLRVIAVHMLNNDNCKAGVMAKRAQ
jgi:hypothetical protein